MTLNRQKLLNALNSVAVALSSKGSNPYGSFVLLTTLNDTLTITADSIDIRAEATIECPESKPGSLLVSHAKLVALLNRNVENVELEAVGSQPDKFTYERLKITVGGSTSLIPLMPAEAFPAPRPDENQKAFVILDNAAFTNSLTVVCPFAGNGLTHAWDIALSIQDDGKDMLMLACDGKQFARIVQATSGTPFSLAIPAKIIRSIVSTVAASESLTMAVFDKSVRFELDGLTLQLRLCDLQYPENVRQVCERMDKGCNHSVTVDRASLVSELQIASAQVERDEDGVGICITEKPQALTVYAKSKSSAEHSASIETKVAVGLERRRINVQNVVAYLRSLDCERVRLSYEPEWVEPGCKLTPEFASGISGYFGFFRTT